MALMAITDDVDLPAFARELAQQMAHAGRVTVVDAARMAPQLAAAGMAMEGDPFDARSEAGRHVAALLDEIGPRPGHAVQTQRLEFDQYISLHSRHLRW